jgi:hypothetical protein
VQEQLLLLVEVGAESVTAVLEKYGIIVLITTTENDKLNELKLGSNMPESWDSIDPKARYKAANIELIENPFYKSSMT